jgi:hypothetical protein
MQSGAGRQPSGLKGANMHIVSSALQGGYTGQSALIRLAKEEMATKATKVFMVEDCSLSKIFKNNYFFFCMSLL